MDYPVPGNEAERFEAVKSYDIYGSEPESAFDDLTDLTAQLTGAPISLVNIVGDTGVWVKSRHGVPPELREIPRNAVCCAHAICRSDLLTVSDTQQDSRFKDMPFISTEPFVRFYAGMPLIDSGGHALGTLCVMDLKPREIPFEVEEGIRRLARQTVAQLELRIKLADVQRAQYELAAQKERADRLILNILPAKIAAELSEKGSVEPRHHPSTTIMFSDFAGFTSFAEQLSPRELIDSLHTYFSAFDDIVAAHGLEKLKTVGDAFMCAGGLIDNSKDHAVQTCLAALEIRHYMVRQNEKRQAEGQFPWPMRIGIHTGNAISGVVGKNKFTYDIWGDSVNVAARMESAGEAGKINVSGNTYNHVRNYFEFGPSRTVDVKNKGQMSMRFLTRLKAEFSADPDGVEANDALRKAISGVTANWSLPG